MPDRGQLRIGRSLRVRDSTVSSLSVTTHTSLTLRQDASRITNCGRRIENLFTRRIWKRFSGRNSALENWRFDEARERHHADARPAGDGTAGAGMLSRADV